MPSPQYRGWQTVLLMLLPLAVTAQSVEPTTPDTTRPDTMVAIEMPATLDERPLPPPSLYATDELPLLTTQPVTYPFGMILDRSDDAVVLDYAPARETAEPIVLDSGLVRALMSSARGHLESSELELARSEFDAAAQADPANIDALNGVGWTSAWSGRFTEAGDAFHRALAIDSQNFDAAKGLAYVAHWRGRNDEAAARFGALAAERPADEELAMMHARTLLADRRMSEARAAYERVIDLDPDNIDARNGLVIARSARPKVELTSWLGVTWFDDEERPRAESNLGFRFVEVAIWPTSTSRVWFQYDNGLSLDNVVLSAGNRAVPAGYIGGFIAYGDERNHTTRIELGWRSLPGSIGETLLRSEHVITLPGRYALKGGLWLGLRSDDRTEWVGHTGLRIPLGDRFELNPTFFLASNGMPNEREWRLLLSGEYRFENGWQLCGGLAGGQASTGYIDDYRGISDRYLKVSAPFGRANRMHALFRTEYVGETDATTILSVGVTIGLAER